MKDRDTSAEREAEIRRALAEYYEDTRGDLDSADNAIADLLAMLDEARRELKEATDRDALAEERDAAIARAETAERERDAWCRDVEAVAIALSLPDGEWVSTSLSGMVRALRERAEAAEAALDAARSDAVRCDEIEAWRVSAVRAEGQLAALREAAVRTEASVVALLYGESTTVDADLTLLRRAIADTRVAAEAYRARVRREVRAATLREVAGLYANATPDELAAMADEIERTR